MSSVSVGLTSQDIAWVRAYADEVVRTFGQEFEAAADRLKDGQVLLERLSRWGRQLAGEVVGQKFGQFAAGHFASPVT